MVIEEKKWTKNFEAEIVKIFKENPFEFNEKTKKKIFSIDTPPPYINAPIHIGHATTYAMQDMFARYHRMLGEEVLFPLGLDRNGLPIEVSAEKKFKVRLHSVSREDAVNYCIKILEMTSGESLKSFEDLALSFSSWDFHTGKVGEGYMTDSPEYRSLTQDTFIEMWNKNLIYFDKRINNYSPGLRTTIADSEIEYVDLPAKFVYVKWKVKESGEEIIIGTTRPELIASCGMVIYNPEDDRFKHLEGKTAILPIYGTEVKIKAHTDAKIDKGSGLVMMCSCGDYTDIRFFRELKIKPIISIGIDGCMNENAGFLKGIFVKKARETMIEKLKEENLIEKIDEVMHRTPICERSKVPVEFIEMEELYLKQLDFVSDIEKISEKISFYDSKSRQILLDWFKKISIDWPISRRRFYATEIPIWHCKNCSEKVVPKAEGKYYQPWKDKCPIKKCPKCGSKNFEGETRVLDTWFDSSISPLFNLKYLRNEKFFKENPICSLRPQGKEIVRTWLYYTLLRGYQLTKKPIFKDVWIHHHVVDEKGIKMSKSLGNVINPQVIIEKYGAESFRLWCVSEGNIHQGDLRCSFDRIDGAGKTLSKLWNIARFISMFKFDSKAKYELNEIDKWIIYEMNKLIEFTKEKYDVYDFHNPVKNIKNFLWETFSSHYLELVKTRAYNEEKIFSEELRNGAVYTLNLVLKSLLKILAPVTPIITYKLFNQLYNLDIHKEEFPKLDLIESDKPDFTKEELEELNSEIWKFKRENNLSLKDGIKKAKILSKFNKLEDDLKITHSIENLEFSEKFKLEK